LNDDPEPPFLDVSIWESAERTTIVFEDLALTAKLLLGEFHATKALKSLGYGDDDLGQIRLSRKYRDQPIDVWPLWSPDHAIKRCAPSEFGTCLRLEREFAVYRYAIIEGPQEAGTQVARAFELSAMSESALIIERGRKHLNSQREKAQKKRGYVPELQMTMKVFGIAFHKKPEIRLLSMKARWQAFFGKLRDLGLEVRDKGKIYEYEYKEGYKRISYRTFVSYDRKAPTSR
jgi:hypothetical protein